MFTIVLLLLFTVLCVLLSGDGAWDNVTKPERNSLVFDGRHRGYGAFVLRREYDRRFILAFVGALGVMGLAVAVPKVMAMMGMNMPPTGPMVPAIHIVDRVLQDAPREVPEKKPESPPEKPEAKPSGASTPTPIPEPGPTVVLDSLPAPAPQPGPAPDPKPPVGGGSTGGEPVKPIGGGGPSNTFTRDDPANPGMVDSLPEFFGGHVAMTRFIQDNLQLRDDDVAKAKEWVSFVVDSDGNVVRVKAKGRASRDFSEAAERVVRAMPKWKPAKYHGQEVPCVLVLPIELNTQ